jgi:hypothetical protein
VIPKAQLRKFSWEVLDDPYFILGCPDVSLFGLLVAISFHSVAAEETCLAIER